MQSNQQKQQQQNQSIRSNGNMNQEPYDPSSTNNEENKNLPDKNTTNTLSQSYKQKANEVIEKEQPVKPDDVYSDEKETSGQERKADQQPTQPYPKQQDNEAWKTGTSDVPENASDNPHH